MRDKNSEDQSSFHDPQTGQSMIWMLILRRQKRANEFANLKPDDVPGRESVRNLGRAFQINFTSAAITLDRSMGNPPV